VLVVSAQSIPVLPPPPPQFCSSALSPQSSSPLHTSVDGMHDPLGHSYSLAPQPAQYTRRRNLAAFLVIGKVLCDKLRPRLDVPFELVLGTGAFFDLSHTVFVNGKKNSSQNSITERRVPELIPVLGSHRAGDVSHKPGGRLPLLSARPAVAPATLNRAATNFVAR